MHRQRSIEIAEAGRRDLQAADVLEFDLGGPLRRPCGRPLSEFAGLTSSNRIWHPALLAGRAGSSGSDVSRAGQPARAAIPG